MITLTIKQDIQLGQTTFDTLDHLMEYISMSRQLSLYEMDDDEIDDDLRFRIESMKHLLPKDFTNTSPNDQ